MLYTPEGPFLPKDPSAVTVPKSPTPLASEPSVDFSIVGLVQQERVPKPHGEFNRPSNGYSVEHVCTKQLSWSPEKFQLVKVSTYITATFARPNASLQAAINTLVDNELDRLQPRTAQNANKRQVVYEKVSVHVSFQILGLLTPTCRQCMHTPS